MDHYYGVVRSDSNTLSHYGVKGMRWGVRKAIEKGNIKRLDKHYEKAVKKLAKLNTKANINKQQNIASKYKKATKIAGGIGLAGLGAAGGAHLGQNSAWNKYHKDIGALYDKHYPWHGNTRTGPSVQDFIANNKDAQKILKNAQDTYWNLRQAKVLASGVGALGSAVALGTGAKYIAAKRRTTAAGHAAAVARRNEFQREMNKAFAGTKYAKQLNKKKRRSHNG